jgi:hypothetical protein
LNGYGIAEQLFHDILVILGPSGGQIVCKDALAFDLGSDNIDIDVDDRVEGILAKALV